MNKVVGSVDAAAILDSVSAAYARAAGSRNDLLLEIYRRVSKTVRISIDSSREVTTRTGRDDGLAVRVSHRTDRGIGFAAASGWGSGPIAWTLDRAEASRRGDDSMHLPPPRGNTDVEEELQLPSPAKLADWIRPLVEDLRVPSAWIEAGVTAEALAGPTGAWARGRSRIWAVFLGTARGIPEGAERPTVIAAKSLDALPIPAWNLGYECLSGLPGTPSDPDRLPIWIDPEPASTLIQAIAAARLAGWITDRSESGADWCLSNDPLDRESLLGGRFDDCGFPTQRIELARAGHWCPIPASEGLYRRSSYRDVPSPILSSLRFHGASVPVPEDHYRVGSVRVLSLDRPRWIVEIEGGRWRNGRPVEILRGARLHTTPQSLAASCLGAVEETSHSSWAARTPGLLFDGLRIRA